MPTILCSTLVLSTTRSSTTAVADDELKIRVDNYWYAGFSNNFFPYYRHHFLLSPIWTKNPRFASRSIFFLLGFVNLQKNTLKPEPVIVYGKGLCLYLYHLHGIYPCWSIDFLQQVETKTYMNKIGTVLKIMSEIVLFDLKPSDCWLVA